MGCFGKQLPESVCEKFALRTSARSKQMTQSSGEKDWGVTAGGLITPPYRRLLRGKSARPSRAKSDVAGSGITVKLAATDRVPPGATLSRH